MKKKEKKQNVAVQDFMAQNRCFKDASAGIENAIRSEAANNIFKNAEAEMNNIGFQFAKATDAQLAGRVAEIHHASTFNADAALKGRGDIRAVTTASQGRPYSSSDLDIIVNGEKTAEAQIKYIGTAEKTAKQLSRPEYLKMQKVGPADQISKVKEVSGRLAAKNSALRPKVARHYRDTSIKASDQIRHENVESSSLSLKESRKLARQARKGKVNLQKNQNSSVGNEILTASGSAAIQGAKFAGLSTLAMSGAGNAKDWSDGRMTGKDAICETAYAVATSAIDGAVKAATGTAIRAGAEALSKKVGKEVAGSLVKTSLKGGASRLASSNVAFAAGTVAVDVISGAAKVISGKMSGGEYVKSVGSSTACVSAGMAGGKAGAALGTMVCPGVGTIVGGIAGSIAGSIGGSSIFSKIFG